MADQDNWWQQDAQAPTGDAYLKTLDPARAAQVKALAEGRMEIPKGNALRSGPGAALLADVATYDPTFDAANAPARRAARMKFTSGTQGQNITSFNTALGHLDTLAQAAEGLDNSNFPLWNRVANGFENATGDPRITQFKVAKQAVVEELGRAFKGAAPTVNDSNNWESAINDAQSPAQLRAGIKQAAELLQSRIGAMRDSYNAGMGTTNQPLPMLNDHAEDALSHFQSPDYLEKGYGAIAAAQPQDGAPPAGGSPASAALPPPAGDVATADPGAQQIALAKGGAEDDVTDPTTRAINAQVSGMIAAGKDAATIRAYIQSAGIDPSTVQSLDESVAYRAKHPGGQGGYPVNIAKAAVPMSATRQAINGAAQSSLGAYAMGAGNALTAGYLDELTGNAPLANAGKALVRDQHPVADLIGNVTGGAIGAYGSGAALRGLGVGTAALAGRALSPQALVGDALYGGAYGSGENNDDRLGGAALGAALGSGGGALGRGAVSVLGRAVSPSGGALSSLYAAGVRPTLGQRVVGTGLIGDTVNKLEEAYQSVPIAGSAVRGTRQRARDQFERGAFNSSLADIGSELPTNIPLGTEPHAFAQAAFTDAYTQARAGMRFVPDQQYQVDRTAFQRRLTSGVLSEDQATRVASILDNAVTSRLQAGRGALSGDAYKAASSDIGKVARQMSKTDPMMAEALNDYGAIVDNAARRASPPEAVAALDAADRGYAKLVRIEKAAEARGGDTGRFSPAQFDRAVQQASGGVRSKAYLRGDALMGEYANAGKSLSDRLPNSGTTDRALLGWGLGGAGAAFNPKAALTGALPAIPYLPGVRVLTTGLAAPRNSQGVRTLGALLRSRAALGGQVSAPLAIESFTDR